MSSESAGDICQFKEFAVVDMSSSSQYLERFYQISTSEFGINKSIQPRLLAVSMTLPAFAAERRCRSICRAHWTLNTNPPHAAAAVERWDRRTDARPLHCARAYYVGSVSNTKSL